MISAKTLIPQRRQSILCRPRLVERIRQHVDKALTLVSAPAGYGKTSLLADFCSEPPFPVCWLSLDESDRDVRAFVNHLVAAIQRRFPGFGEYTRRALDANPDANAATLGNVIVQDVADHAPEFFVLVLDDYHVVDQVPRVGDLLDVILKHADRRLHLIVASRTIPVNLPLVLLVAQERIASVGQEDLAFTADEVQTLMHNMHNLDLTPEQASELIATSEGWITGIVLATASMWHGIRDALGRARTQQGPIYAYLADQVFEDQPPPLRETMLIMSTLAEMNETLCRQALGMGGAESVLQDLERHGLFLTTVVDEADVRHYRYHHLFRDFLQTRLREQDPARFQRLHQQAADWFEAQQEWVRAVAHRRAAGDARAAAQTMENGAKPMLVSGRFETLVAWYEEVPKALQPEFPLLLLHTARALVDLGRADDAVPLLHQAETVFDARGETKRAFFAVLLQATVHCFWGRYADALAVVQRIFQSTHDYPAITAEAHRLAGLACLNLGRPGEAVEHLQIALDLYRKLGTDEIAVTYLDLSFALLRLGRLAEGWACQDKAIELYRSSGALNWRLAMTLNDVACARHYLTGDYVRALALLREALDVARASGSPRAQAFALLSTADLYRDLGALEKAQELYAQAEEIARRSGHADLINFALMGAAQAFVQGGDVVKALGMAAQAHGQAERRGDVYQLGLSRLTLGAAHLGAGNLQPALDEIEAGRDQLEASDARRDLTRAYMLLARARRVAGDVAAALEALERALDVGIETHTLHYLIVEGQHVFDLFKQLLRQNPADRRPAQVMDRIRALPDIAREALGGLALTASSQQPVLRFYGFGPGRVEQDGQTIAWSPSPKTCYMTFYLLAHALLLRSPRNRDQIIAAFWPDARRGKVSTFHWMKNHIHNTLERAFIVYEDGLYKIAWDPDCWFDVLAFEALLDGRGPGRRARLEKAVLLYQGDFLQGYDDEWCLPARERLRARYRDALLELGQLLMEEEEFAGAFSVLNRAIAIDDLHEPATRALMHCHALDGRPRVALDLFRRFKRQLRRELDAQPEPETQSLYRSIQASSLPLS